MPTRMVVCTDCKGFGKRSGQKCPVCDGKGVFDPESKKTNTAPAPRHQPIVNRVNRPTIAAPPVASRQALPKAAPPHPTPLPPAPHQSDPLPLYAENPRTLPVLITVIVLSQNNVDGALRSIRGALNHSHKNVEVLLVDDGSTDDTPRVSASITDSRFLVIRRPWQSGSDAARRLGIAQASGQYVIIFNAGEMVDPKIFDSPIDTAPVLNLDAIENGTLYQRRKVVP